MKVNVDIGPATVMLANWLRLVRKKSLSLSLSISCMRSVGLSPDISYRLNEPPTRRQTAKPSKEEKKVINCVLEERERRSSSLTFSYLSSITAALRGGKYVTHKLKDMGRRATDSPWALTITMLFSPP